MEIRNNILGKGLYATIPYIRNKIVFTLSGIEYDKPTRETIHIGNNSHIYDQYGIYMNHSFNPTTFINNYDVIAKVDINIGDELTFDYNQTEINMASPFVSDGILVEGTKY